MKKLRVRDPVFLIPAVAASVVVVIVQRRIVKVVVVVVVVVVIFHRLFVFVKILLRRKKVLEWKLKLELVVLGEEVLVRLALTTANVR